ncbi:MAG: type III-B CRISPR-associated protein Cas10/Cmr2 [Gammaproteobacteria bacterium]|nr:type III-B CRISPR-associated protein Cas10/Cmr2 [Gammaproteobacteria bacterium]
MNDSNNNLLWKTKLAAWVHDPAEKALVLLRDKTGHEWGTVAELREILFGNRMMPSDVKEFVKLGDWYAAAADRPQFPTSESDHRYAKWAQVDYAKNPVLKHPLTGKDYCLQPLTDISLEDIKTNSKSHFESLIHKRGDEVDQCRTLLAFWRFGPDTPHKLKDSMHNLWQCLPADTRVPDHTIWSHLDTVSAFAGAMALDQDKSPSLLTVSLGPVQELIFESRTTSDLWAGSHLLSHLAWQGMCIVAKSIGPDSIIFPNLRGVPIVDVWLRDTMGLRSELFEGTDWARTNQRSDANPLFSAGLPNRFVAIVPADKAQSLAEEIKLTVQQYFQKIAKEGMDKVLAEIGEKPDGQYCYSQIEQQLEGFPEVHWAAVPWRLAESRSKPKSIDVSNLESALDCFVPEGEASHGEAPHFLKSDAWKLLGNELRVENIKFYAPNPGVLYPALYDLLDRLAAAGKSVHPFSQLNQKGYRSNLNGEREWLALEQSQIHRPPGKRSEIETIWSRLAKQRPSWVKQDEYLDALSMVKRLWPTIFTERVQKTLGTEELRRYTISTHALAFSVSLEQWCSQEDTLSEDVRSRLQKLDKGDFSYSLPRRLLRKIRGIDSPQKQEDAELLRNIFPYLYEREQEQPGVDAENITCREIRKCLSLPKPEAYYGILLFDGDKMGAWIAGNEEKFLIRFKEVWHPKIRNSVLTRFEREPDIMNYLNEKRPSSPARHQVISEALNAYSLRIARYVVEECFKGKLIYAGGDDIMAMVCTDDILSVMNMLNLLYSGESLDEPNKNLKNIKSGGGYVRIKGKLVCTMGNKATASCGAVVAHHQTPLSMVLRELRAAESLAKDDGGGGRDAFCLKILKRSGGMINLVSKWSCPSFRIPDLIKEMSRIFAEDISRRAAYHIVTRLRRLPQNADPKMLEAIMRNQFARKVEKTGHDEELTEIANRLATLMSNDLPEKERFSLLDLENLLMTAEFLGRQSRRN